MIVAVIVHQTVLHSTDAARATVVESAAQCSLEKRGIMIRIYKVGEVGCYCGW